MADRFLSLNRAKSLKIILPLAIILAAVISIYFPDYAKLMSLRRANNDLNRRIEKTRKEIEELKRKLDRIGKDPLIYEKAAREDLGAAKESEIVIDIVE